MVVHNVDLMQWPPTWVKSCVGDALRVLEVQEGSVCVEYLMDRGAVVFDEAASSTTDVECERMGVGERAEANRGPVAELVYQEVDREEPGVRFKRVSG